MLRYLARRMAVAALTGAALGVFLTTLSGTVLPPPPVSWWGITTLAAVLLTLRQDITLILTKFNPVYQETVDALAVRDRVGAMRFKDVTTIAWHEFLAYLEIRGRDGKEVLFACNTPDEAAALLWFILRRIHANKADTHAAPPWTLRVRELLPPAVLATWTVASALVLLPLVPQEYLVLTLGIHVAPLWVLGEMIRHLFEAAWRFEQTPEGFSFSTLFRSREIKNSGIRRARIEVLRGRLFWCHVYILWFPIEDPLVCTPASCAWLPCSNIDLEGKEASRPADAVQPENDRTEGSTGPESVPHREETNRREDAREDTANESGGQVAVESAAPEQDAPHDPFSHRCKPSLLKAAFCILCALPILAIALFSMPVVAITANDAAAAAASLGVGLMLLVLGLVLFCNGALARRHVVDLSHAGLSYPHRKGKPCLPFSAIRRMDLQPFLKRMRVSGGDGQPVIYLRSSFKHTQSLFREIVNRIPVDVDITPEPPRRNMFLSTLAPALVFCWLLALAYGTIIKIAQGDGSPKTLLVLPVVVAFLAIPPFLARRKQLRSVLVEEGMVVFRYGKRKQTFSMDDVADVRLSADLNSKQACMRLYVSFYNGTRTHVQPLLQDKFCLFVYLRRELNEWWKKQQALEAPPESEKIDHTDNDCE